MKIWCIKEKTKINLGNKGEAVVNISQDIENLILQTYGNKGKNYLQKPYVTALHEYLQPNERLSGVLFGEVTFMFTFKGALWVTNKRLLFTSSQLGKVVMTEYAYQKINTVSLIPSWPHSIQLSLNQGPSLLLIHVDNEIAAQFVKKINEVRSALESSASGKANTENSIADELVKLANLMSQGLITEEEFVQAKKSLLVG